MIKVVSFTGALTDTGEDGVTTVGNSNVVDKLHNKNGLADTGTTEKTNFTTTGVRSKKVDNLDTSDKNIVTGTELSVGWSFTVDGVGLLGRNGPSFIDRLTNDVDDTAKSFFSDRNLDRSTSIDNRLATSKTLSGIHSNSTYSVVTKVLRDLKYQTDVVVLDFKGVQNLGDVSIVEGNVDNSSNNLRNAASTLGRFLILFIHEAIRHALHDRLHVLSLDIGARFLFCANLGPLFLSIALLVDLVESVVHRLADCFDTRLASEWTLGLIGLFGRIHGG
mmetsp:Transcript_25709/g.48006  ORF Transcript_25709/g.48006 Transcript_25709/m.48006 type:complete len:277 (-) Transcript_25709:127-957(-)